MKKKKEKIKKIRDRIEKIEEEVEFNDITVEICNEQSVQLIKEKKELETKLYKLTGGE